MLSMLSLRLAVVPTSFFLQPFQKCVQSLQSLTFIRKFLSKFFLLYNF